MRLGRAKITAFTAMAAALVLLTTFRAGPPQTASASRPVLTPSPTVEPTPSPTPEPTPSPTPEPTPSPTPEPTRWYYGDSEVNEETTDILVLPVGEITELTGLAEHMPNLRTIRFGDREPDAKELALLAETFPHADVVYRVTLAGQKYGRDCSNLDLTALKSDEVDQALEKLSLLPNAKYVKLTENEDGTGPTPEDVYRFQTAFPEILFDYSFTLWGKSVSNQDEVLDLSHIAMDDGGEAVRKALPCMTKCTMLDMDSCGVSNEDMAAIRDKFPNIKVVWRIWFGRFYTCRTDVEKILASLGDGDITNENGAQSLQYCTDVRYLDLGHNPNLDDITFVSYMPELEVAILAVNDWTDAAPLASCKKLEYLEMFNTQCTDLAPLTVLKNLRHLNVCYLKELEDISPLMGMTWLERLWVGRDNKAPEEDLQALQAALPDCVVNITNQDDPTGDGWRVGERYELLREQFDYESGEYSTK